MSRSPILFLDIDGVLNTRESIDPLVGSSTLHRDKVDRLNGVLICTDAWVVVSSAWRYLIHRGDMTLGGFDWLLRSHGMISGRLLGVTDPDTMVDGLCPIPNERGRQISAWLKAHAPNAPYAVVDDQDLGISAAGHPFVRTLGDLGLCDIGANRLVAMLRGRK